MTVERNTISIILCSEGSRVVQPDLFNLVGEHTLLTADCLRSKTKPTIKLVYGFNRLSLNRRQKIVNPNLSSLLIQMLLDSC